MIQYINLLRSHCCKNDEDFERLLLQVAVAYVGS